MDKIKFLEIIIWVIREFEHFVSYRGKNVFRIKIVIIREWERKYGNKKKAKELMSGFNRGTKKNQLVLRNQEL